MRTRPPKKSPELLARLVELIEKCYTVKDACKICGISTTTFNRWRDKDLEFNKNIILATQNQWKHIDEVKAAKQRVYTRSVIISPDYDQNALKSPLNASQSHFIESESGVIDGVPVRHGNIYDDKPYIPCVDEKGLFVTFIEKHGAIAYHRRYTLSEWLGMHSHKYL